LKARALVSWFVSKLLKKVKEHCVQKAQSLSSNHYVLPWCAQALAFIELPVDNINSQDFNFSLAVHFCQKLVAKMLRQEKMIKFFPFLSVFQRSDTHFRVALEAHQAVTIKARVCCVRVCSFNILV
jgi:hypothetical protein